MPQDEELQEATEKEDKKKKKDKKEKKDKDKNKNELLEDEDEKEGLGSKLLLVFVTLIIIAIWLGIFGILIKYDVGGFGSTVLYPILKDVPVANKILPEVIIPDETEKEAYSFDSLDEAIAYIKQLEQQLADAQNNNTASSSQLEELKTQVAELEKLKQDQADFENLKQKFYEEVVFSDKAPDIKEYKTYYESIEPQNAEVLYKQVVEQVQKDEEIEQYASRYSKMEPKKAAAIFDKMTDDYQLVAKILKAMTTQQSSDILAAMKAENSAQLTKIMEP